METQQSETTQKTTETQRNVDTSQVVAVQCAAETPQSDTTQQTATAHQGTASGNQVKVFLEKLSADLHGFGEIDLNPWREMVE